MSMNIYGGVNDMPKNFTKTELGRRVYTLWFGMLRRCYDVNQLSRSKGRSYSKVVVCERWFYLKNFFEDIQKLDGYVEWSKEKTMALDKDLCAQEVTKIYSPNTCRFLTKRENTLEAISRSNIKEAASKANKTLYVIFKNDEYRIFNSEQEACDFLGVSHCTVSKSYGSKCKCKGWNVIKIGKAEEFVEE